MPIGALSKATRNRSSSAAAPRGPRGERSGRRTCRSRRRRRGRRPRSARRASRPRPRSRRVGRTGTRCTHSAQASTAFAQADAARAASSGWIAAVQPSPSASSAATPAIEHQRSLTYSYSPVADATNTPTGALASRARNTSSGDESAQTPESASAGRRAVGRRRRDRAGTSRQAGASHSLRVVCIRSFFGKIGPDLKPVILLGG